MSRWNSMPCMRDYLSEISVIGLRMGDCSPRFLHGMDQEISKLVRTACCLFTETGFTQDPALNFLLLGMSIQN